MYIVVMVYEDGARTYEPPVNVEHIEQLRIAVKALMHEGDYVHGAAASEGRTP